MRESTMTDLNTGVRYVARATSREFVTRQIAEETLIVPVAGGVGDLDAIYTLNEVAARIWKIVESPSTVDRIVDEIARDFEVPADQAARDVLEFLDGLESAGLITSADTPHAGR
jgi:Coenzyme PQQ synthesis protein D (PqqD)